MVIKLRFGLFRKNKQVKILTVKGIKIGQISNKPSEWTLVMNT